MSIEVIPVLRIDAAANFLAGGAALSPEPTTSDPEVVVRVARAAPRRIIERTYI